MPSIHMAQRHPAKVDMIDEFGDPLQGEPGDLLPVTELHMSTVEFDLWGLLNTHRGMLNALKQMVFPGQTEAGSFTHQVNPDIADNTVTFLRNEAERVYFKIASIPENDVILLAARGMLRSYVDALRQVDVTKDSAPGVRLANLWRWCAWHLIRANSSNVERDEAVVRWKQERKAALKR